MHVFSDMKSGMGCFFLLHIIIHIFFYINMGPLEATILCHRVSTVRWICSGFCVFFDQDITAGARKT